jgi:ubiquinone/menaquinone biosynthesis C-methylase UbiE
MPDVWATVAELDATTQDRLADVLEVRGADAAQQDMRREFLTEIPLPERAEVLELGCGTGVLTRRLARLPQVARVTGVDVAPSLLERATVLAAELPDVSFQQADARALPFPDGDFDVVVADSVLVHVPGVEAAISESFRVLRPGGRLALFEGDYATTTVALGDHDPLQCCADAMMAASVTDRWLVRRLPRLLADTGFAVQSLRSHGFVDAARDGYMVTVVDRGADSLVGAGQIGPELAAALKAEARRRSAAGTFFGHIAYASLIAERP